MKSDEFFRMKFTAEPGPSFSGITIDGDHDAPQPLRDAMNAAAVIADTGVILLHDGTGRPVREAVEYLMANGFKARPYFTPHLVFVCWRGAFEPPQHVPDPTIKALMLDGRNADFDFTRCE